MDRPVRVTLKDASEIVLHGLSGMLREHPDRATLVEWSDTLLAPGQVDLILLESTEPTAEANLRRLEELVVATPTKVVPLVRHADLDEIVEVLAAGAGGYLWQGLRAEELMEALEDICRDVVLRRPGVAYAHEQIRTVAGLSKREFEVLLQIARGVSNQEIADTAYLSLNSVKTYIRGAYRKIGVTRRAQAVRWVLESGVRPVVLSAGYPSGPLDDRITPPSKAPLR